MNNPIVLIVLITLGLVEFILRVVFVIALAISVFGLFVIGLWDAEDLIKPILWTYLGEK